MSEPSATTTNAPEVQPTQPIAAVATSAPMATGGGAQKTPTVANLPGAFEFMPVMSEAKQQWLKMLIYGPAGSGKTTLSGSSCNLDASSDVLLITAEGGDMVFRNNPRITRPEKIDMIRAVRIEQVQKVYEWLTYHIRARNSNNEQSLRNLQNIAFFGDANITKEAALQLRPDFDYDRLRRFRTVIIDSMTDVEAQNMNHIMGIDDAKGFDVGEELNPAGYTEFRKNNNTIQQLTRSFRNLEIHVIIICGQRFSKDERNQFHYNPWLTGQLSTQIQSFVDVVGYMIPSSADQTKPNLRRLYVQPQAAVRFDAKCRIASLNKDYFDDPVLEDILRAAGFLK